MSLASLPSRERGLKQGRLDEYRTALSRSLHGSVD